MHRLLADAFAAFLATLGLSAAAQPTLTPEQLFERVSPSVWVVHTLDSERRPLMQGSAVVIGPGQLVTNCHVLRGARSVSVGRENMRFGATLEHPDTERDLCLLKVANFTVPAVTTAPTDSLRAGARVYAIGAPRGLETTISDGLLSGIRRNAAAAVEALQISVPISPGSSGGGLFDAQGRLIGITNAGLRDAQNLNFALPAGWIAEVPARAQAALAAKPTARATPQTSASAPGAPTGDRVFEYRLRDRYTGVSQPVVMRLDRIDGDKRIFDQGGRVERLDGGVESVSRPVGGEFDLVMPPGGWVSGNPEPGSTWRLDYTVRRNDLVVRMELRARTMESTRLTVDSREIDAVRVNYSGFTHRITAGHMNTSAPYEASAWYAPSLRRVVRFEVRAHAQFIRIDEILELVDIRSE
jgi:serine protease Do